MSISDYYFDEINSEEYLAELDNNEPQIEENENE
tara:strand:- start:259 stop:360 length:102 start_codon:yes stop_codon:yes gene_type:complete